MYRAKKSEYDRISVNPKIIFRRNTGLPEDYRVKINEFPDPYYHASRTRIASGNYLVVAQGPRLASDTNNDTMEKFLKMLLCEDIHHVFTMGKTEENGVKQYDNYVPENVNDELNVSGGTVVCTSRQSEVDGHVIVKSLKIYYNDP